MKMNDLDALEDLVTKIPEEFTSVAPAGLKKYQPKTKDNKINGVPVVDAGGVPIIHMRHLMRTGRLSEDLVAHIESTPRK